MAQPQPLGRTAVAVAVAACVVGFILLRSSWLTHFPSSGLSVRDEPALVFNFAVAEYIDAVQDIAISSAPVPDLQCNAYAEYSADLQQPIRVIDTTRPNKVIFTTASVLYGHKPSEDLRETARAIRELYHAGSDSSLQELLWEKDAVHVYAAEVAGSTIARVQEASNIWIYTAFGVY
ncbi:hypothetical protein LTR17_020956 [Elasticomyces elasticus]|nr:hypothetical protein LTR17_020956 [Elasticomyces elasticus]